MAISASCTAVEGIDDTSTSGIAWDQSRVACAVAGDRAPHTRAKALLFQASGIDASATLLRVRDLLEGIAICVNESRAANAGWAGIRDTLADGLIKVEAEGTSAVDMSAATIRNASTALTAEMEARVADGVARALGANTLASCFIKLGTVDAFDLTCTALLDTLAGSGVEDQFLAVIVTFDKVFASVVVVAGFLVLRVASILAVIRTVNGNITETLITNRVPLLTFRAVGDTFTSYHIP